MEIKISKIIVIVGPTGVGKTKLSIELAKKYDAEIINADSVQMYKDLNIGSAKVTPDEMQGVRHHLIDFLDIDREYTVYDYQKDARKILDKLILENKNVVIVGGTGLYIKALLYDYEFGSIINDNTYEEYSNEELYKIVKEKNSDSNIHINNRRRLIAYLNREQSSKNGDKKLYDFITIGLTTDRENLYNIINNRVDKMIDNGLEKEVRALYDRNKQARILSSAIGYKEFIEYFNGDIEHNEVIDKIKQNSRRYAKRQYTFFNNKMDVNWFMVNYDNFDETIKNVIDFI